MTLRALTLLASLAGPLACSEVVTIDNSPPVLEALGLCQAPDSGRWYLKIAVADAEREPVDLRLVDEGGQTLAPGPTGSGFEGLPTVAPPDRQVLLIEWAQDGDADTGAQVTADLPGSASACRFLTAAPTFPLNLNGFVDDGEAVFEQAVTFSEALDPAECVGQQ